MLLRKIVAREELQGPLIISSGCQEKGGGPLIRACSVIRSNTVPNFTGRETFCENARMSHRMRDG